MVQSELCSLGLPSAALAYVVGQSGEAYMKVLLYL